VAPPPARQIADQVKADLVSGTLDGDEQVMSTNRAVGIPLGEVVARIEQLAGRGDR
jgi:hypothetical protein